MKHRLSRRGFVAGATAGLGMRFLPARGDTFAPSAASLARPAAPPRNLSGLAVRDGEGRAVALEIFRGVTLVLNFWAPWCEPCRREMPSLSRLAARLEGTRVQVVPVGFDPRGAAALTRFYAQIGVRNLPVMLGDAANYAATLGTDVLPTTLVLDAAGQERASVSGEANWDDNPTLTWLAGLSR